jgi:hypothetical protein
VENNSAPQDRYNLPTLINGLPDHWTLAAFVPNASGVHYAKSLGFPKDNIAVWNTEDSFLEVGEVIRSSTDNFMRGRTQGVRGSKSLFTMTTADPKKIKKTLVPMTPGSYTIDKVLYDVRIDEFTKMLAGGSYTPGRTYYEMTKRETIQGYKGIAIRVDADRKLYVGDAARDLIGIPKDTDVRVSPGDHPGYKVFVQSTSMNRKLIAGTEALIMR